MDFITARNLYKTYPNGYHALRNLHFSIEKGELVFLTGHSGAGKSTLFRLLAGFDHGTSGHLQVGTWNLMELGEKNIPFFRRRIGMVFQDYRLLNTRTVFENVAIPLEIRKEPRFQIEKKVHRILEEMGLAHKYDEFPLHLSGGEQQRVAVARALVHSPELLVADEPTGSLDPDRSLEILSILESANARGTTMIIATHDLEMVHRKNHREIQLQQGEIVQSSNKSDAVFQSEGLR